ncbi:plasmid recombination protein [Priestia aryabhattai]|uniref:plasmid recombination protein n=1 Tax=Priestia aryabhattai TaxID=412384 RepID=UPI003D2945C0
MDSNRTMLNYDFVNEDKIKYHEEIKKMTATRVKRKIRNDAVLVAEFFVSASPEYMHAMSPDEQRKYFEASLDHISGKYGQQNILYAVVHTMKQRHICTWGLCRSLMIGAWRRKSIFMAKPRFVEFRMIFTTT